jgi:hypothetical protein
MSVDVNETGRNNQSRCIDRFASVTAERAPDFSDEAILDGDVTDITWGASPIDNGSVNDFQIEHVVTLGLCDLCAHDF